jgi:putative transposase
VTDAALGAGKGHRDQAEDQDQGDGSSRPAGAESSVEEVRARLAGLLPDDALQDALEGLRPEEITGPGGLMSQLAGRVLETALGAELTEHLGYPPGQAPPGGAGNHRNGHTAKTVQTDLGAVEVRTPRDRNGTFEPQLVSKRQTRLAGLDERVLDLYAGGMSVRDIAAHLQSLYGVQIGRDTISRVTDAVLEDVQAWRSRPLEAVYPIVYFDALHVKVREDRSVRTRGARRVTRCSRVLSATAAATSASRPRSRCRRARVRARSRSRRWPCRSPARGRGSAPRRTSW